MVRLSAIAGLAGLLLVPGCTNNPYPDIDQGKKVLYSSFNEAPKTLDPAVAYTTAEHVVTGTVYETLLEYHFLKRPYELIPGIADAVPKPETQADGRQAPGQPQNAGTHESGRKHRILRCAADLPDDRARPVGATRTAGLC